MKKSADAEPTIIFLQQKKYVVLPTETRQERTLVQSCSPLGAWMAERAPPQFVTFAGRDIEKRPPPV
ncbi:hypothetical protein, partial [Burkholderia cenocepacia]|uniref:hypothetical protein n=1 Tax=Burkholderia cenocepacia TaxID=95486 RepID=UPI001955B707